MTFLTISFRFRVEDTVSKDGKDHSMQGENTSYTALSFVHEHGNRHAQDGDYEEIDEVKISENDKGHHILDHDPVHIARKEADIIDAPCACYI